MKKNGYAHVLLIGFLVAGLLATVYLVGRQTNIFPKASSVLGPETSSNRIFVTSSSYGGDLGGLSGADAKCQEKANGASLGGVWKAWISSSSDSPSFRFTHSNNPYKLINGTIVANNWTDLTDGLLLSPINTTEKGITVEGSVWSNTSAAGYSIAYNCSDWTSSLSSAQGGTGQLSQITGSWTNNGRAGCLIPRPLYCIEDSSPASSSTPVVSSPSISPISKQTPSPVPASSSKTSTPASSPSGNGSLDQPQTIKVLVIKYFPLDPSNNTRLDPNIVGYNMSVTGVRDLAAREVQDVITNLTEASKFRGYKNPGATPYLNFSIVENKEYLEKIPNSTILAWGKSGIYRPDYKKVLERENICNYVDNLGVSQVWLRGYHYGNQEPDESNMSMGRSSQAFWNFGTYGDVSNSQTWVPDFLPICNKTYVLYGIGGLGNTLENHLHHLENLFRFVDKDNLFNNFTNPNSLNDGTVNHCGWTHCPPNGNPVCNSDSTHSYDWRNEQIVKSDCEDWKPDGGGQVKDVSCHTWYGSGPCLDDTGVRFKVWLMQSYPGYNNNLTYQGKNLRNWLEFYADFDAALARGKSLVGPSGSGVLGINSGLIQFIKSFFH